VFVVFMAVRQAFYDIVLFYHGRGKKFRCAMIAQELPTFFESLPLSLKSLSVYSVFRLTVIVVNRIFTPEIAAIYSILIVTIRGYITQLFVSVIRPMIVPLTASVNIADFNEVRKVPVVSALNSFDSIVVTSTVMLAFLVPWWLPFWLGADMVEYLPVFMVGIVALGLEASTAIKNLLLISQGHGLALTRLTVICAAVFLVYMTIVCLLLPNSSLFWLLAGVLLFVSFLSGVQIPLLFRRLVLSEENGILWKRLFFYIVCLSLSLVFGIRLIPFSDKLGPIVGIVMLLIHILCIYNPLKDDFWRAKLRSLAKR
ncbi:MAG: hypothetical protein KC592_08410, partial [Nitrospira sp.]|nr:hypothetical protein [Nitrospira sp.]